MYAGGTGLRVNAGFIQREVFARIAV